MPSNFGSWAADNRLKMLVLLVLALAAVALAAYTYLTVKQSKYVMTGPNTISVTGEGEIFAKPDIATFSFAVMKEAADAVTAQSQSAEGVNQIMAFLKSNGIEEKDIKTIGYDLSPKYEWNQVTPCTQFGCPPGEQKLVGYTVTQTIEVKVRDTAKSGDLISGVGENGATNVSSIAFTIDEDDELKSQAREMAIADAREKAQELADDLDVRLVKLMNYWEQEGPVYPMYGYGGEAAMMDSSMRTAPMMPTGENNIKSTVTLVYEIR